MNKRQTEVEKAKLAAEAQELKHLKAIYNKAAEDIAKNISITDGKIEVMLQEWDSLSDDDKSVYQSKIYQKNFQKQLQSQINGILKDLNSGQYSSIDEYLKKCYETGYIGTMYDIAGQGIPIITPIDQKKVITAMKTNSKISSGLYTKLGEDVEYLQKRIANNISRGIATSDSYENIARNIANDSNVGMNNAMRIARTEGHRIHSNSAHDAQLAAKDAGAAIVKMWDSTMDGNTRTTHRRLDGQIREVEEPFEMDGKEAMYPSDFGRPEEDINCRCALLQRATWALDDDELETLKEKAKFHEIYVEDDDKETFRKQKDIDLNTFKKRYLKAVDDVSVGVPNPAKTFVPAKTIEEAEEYVKQFVDDNVWGGTGVSLKGIGIDSANAVNEAITKLFDDYDIGKLGGITAPKGNTKLGKLIANAKAAYSPVRKSLLLNSKTMKNLKTLAKEIEEEKRLVAEYLKNPKAFTFSTKRVEAVMKASAVSGRATVPETIEDIINHEFGHTFEKAISQMDNFDLIKANMPRYAEKISGYATTDVGEYIAESFAAYRKGEKIIDPELRKAFEKLKTKAVKSDIITEEVQKLKIYDSKAFETVHLPKQEYAHVMSELNTHLSDEERNHFIVSKAIGNHVYVIENYGFDDYRIIGKYPIDGDV